MKMMYFKIYDHSSDSDMDWKELVDLNTTSTVIEVIGFVAKEDSNYYHLVMSHGDSQYSGCFRVVKSTIIKKKTFRI